VVDQMGGQFHTEVVVRSWRAATSASLAEQLATNNLANEYSAVSGTEPTWAP
jgi:hypothetical protein